MGKYKITLTDLAKKQMRQHEKAGNNATIRKIDIIFRELANHPFSGTGKPEALKQGLKGFWSRRINPGTEWFIRFLKALLPSMWFRLWVTMVINNFQQFFKFWSLNLHLARD